MTAPLDLDGLEAEHKRWMESKWTAQGQREDSTSILALIARVRELEEALSALDVGEE